VTCKRKRRRTPMPSPTSFKAPLLVILSLHFCLHTPAYSRLPSSPFKFRQILSPVHARLHSNLLFVLPIL
jgi:hypothetical protein